MDIEYIRVGDYLLPAITAREPPPDGGEWPMGGYARRRRAFLKEHRPIEYNKLLLTGKLYPHLYEVEETASARRARGVSEEVILSELIYDW